MVRRTLRIVAHALAGVVAVAMIVFAGTALRLASGPIYLDFLTPYVADALRQANSPYAVRFSETVLTWAGWSRPLDIRIRDVRAVTADGAVAASAPEVSIQLSLRALARGMVAPTVLEVIEPKLRLVRGPEGAIQLGLGAEGETMADPSELLLADLLAPPDPERAMGYLSRVSVVDADLTVVDRRLGMSWHAPRATVDLRRDQAGIEGTAALSLEVGTHTADIGVRARYVARFGGLTVWLDLSDVRPDWFAPNAEVLAPLEAVRLPLSGTVELSLAPGIVATRVGFDLTAGAGEVTLGGVLDHPVAIDAAEVRGEVVLDDQRLRIDAASVDLGGPRITLGGTVEGFNDSPAVTAGATLTGLPVDALERYWPPEFGRGARAWITANLTRGVIRKAEASVRLRPNDFHLPRLPEDAVRTTVEVEDVTVNYFEGLPKITGVNGFGTITGHGFDMRTWGGALYGLEVTESTLAIDDIGGAAAITVDVSVRGPVRDALRVLAHPPLGYPQKLGIEPGAVGGEAETDLRFEFPLVRDLSVDRIVFSGRSRLTDVRVADAFDGLEVAGGPLGLRIDGSGMNVAGAVAINGVAGTATWRESFTSEAPFRSRYTFAGTFDEDERAALGLPRTDYLTGPAELGIEIVEPREGPGRWRIEADLRAAAMEIPEIRWEKPAGTDGSLRLELRDRPSGPPEIASIALDAAGLSARGNAALDPETGALRRLTLSELALGETRVTAVVTIADDGAYGVDIRGASVDLRPYLEDDAAAAADGEPAAGGDTPVTLDLEAAVERVVTRDSGGLGATRATLRLVGGRWEAMAVDGVVGDGRRFAARIDDEGKGRVLVLTSDDAGAVLRAFDIFDNAQGGTMRLRAKLDGADGAPVTGKLTIDDFELLEAPRLAKILAVASLTGTFDLLQAKGLPFTRLVVPFTKTGDLISVKDARSYGPAIGFTMKGEIDLAAETAELDGTVVPAYTLNSVFGKIPLLGNILVGDEGGGVFAVSYRLTGPLADPEVSVSPLSALAPGVLRGLFSADLGGPADAGAVAPSSDSSR